MDGPDAQDLLDDLDDTLKELSEGIKPISVKTIQDTAATLPVADKARLYVLTTYAVESLIFSYLKLNGVDPKDHPIRTELSRVRSYVQKIKEAQAAPNNKALDKDAAGRFIKAALAGNDKYDEERAATQARERANAHKRFNVITERMERANEGSEGPSITAQDDEAATERKEKKSMKRKSDALAGEGEDGGERKKKSKKSKDRKSKKKKKKKAE